MYLISSQIDLVQISSLDIKNKSLDALLQLVSDQLVVSHPLKVAFNTLHDAVIKDSR